jgi:hypothetical protein
MKLEVETLKLYDSTISNLELTIRDLLELSLLPAISKGGGNPSGSLTSFEHSRLGMEFREAKVGSNKLGQKKLSKECSISKHHTLLPCVILGVILYSRTWISIKLLMPRVQH